MPGKPSRRRGTAMPISASASDDPALLSVDGPIATITLNRPAAFNSIDLSIAKKLEQLGAEVEASDEIRVLVIDGTALHFGGGGICRPFAGPPPAIPWRLL